MPFGCSIYSEKLCSATVLSFLTLSRLMFSNLFSQYLHSVVNIRVNKDHLSIAILQEFYNRLMHYIASWLKAIGSLV